MTIGTFIRIMEPQATENRMNGDAPLGKTLHPLIAMKRPSTLQSAPIISGLESDRSLSFVLNERTLNINQSCVILTACGGNHCDKQRISDWNGIKGCSCFAMN